MDKLIEKIKSIAEERFKEIDLSDCFMVDVSLNGSKMEVYIDSDEGVKFSQCQKLSRAIEAYLDESEVLGPKYILEVSSPGLERPLKFQRQYKRNLGRSIETRTKGGEQIVGKLILVDQKSITIETKASKKKAVESHEILFEDIDQSKILITFSK